MSKLLSFLVSILLLLPILALPSAQSQSYTTITTQTTSLMTSYQTSTLTVSAVATNTGRVDIFDHITHIWVTLPSKATNTSFTLDLRHITIPAGTGILNYTPCYSFAASFEATKDQTLSGSIGPANVPVGFYVTDNSSFQTWGLPLLATEVTPCSYDVLPLNMKMAVNLPPPYYPYPVPNYVAPLRNYTATIPSSGTWWIVGYVDGRVTWPSTISWVKWSWSAFLSPSTYVTTMTSFSTVTQPITLTATLNFAETKQLGQAFSFSISAEQLYAGLAAVFGVLLIITVGLLVKQRNKKR